MKIQSASQLLFSSVLAMFAIGCGDGDVVEVDQKETSNQDAPEGACSDIESDPKNCGSCGDACAAGQRCASGRCVDADIKGTCAENQETCAGACSALDSDAKNCGSCGTQCLDGEVCSAGKCVDSGCRSSETSCNDQCVDLQSSVEHCGTCGVVCDSTEQCLGGKCGDTLSCAPGQEICGDSCASVNSDPLHCGSCDVVCSQGEGCLSGECAGFACPTGEVRCAEQCVDPQADQDNCGGCDVVCSSGDECTEGQCVPRCAVDLVECGGACIDPLADQNYCGATDCLAGNSTSGEVCGAGSTCESGECKLDCGPERIECGGACVAPLRDRNYCGATDCSELISSGTVCLDGNVCDAGVCGDFVFTWGDAAPMQTVGKKTGSNRQGLGTDIAGNATMVWREFGQGTDVSTLHLKTRRYDFATQTSGPIHQIDNATQATGNPSLSVAANGDAAVAWTEVLPPSVTGNSVFVSIYSAVADEWTTPTRVDDTSAAQRFESTIAMDAVGGMWVAWTEDIGAGEFRTTRRHFIDGSWGDLGTNPERIEVLNGYTDEDGSSFGQKLVSNDNGDVALAWYDYNWSFGASNASKNGKVTMVVSIYDADNNTWSPPQNVRGSTTNWSRLGAHDIAIDPSGDAHVTWGTWVANPPTQGNRMTRLAISTS